MKQGPGRFRRVATACAAGTIALSFLSVLAITTPAGAAAVPGPVGTTTAGSAPTIRPNLANQAAGNWTINLNPGAAGNNAGFVPTTCAGTPAEAFFVIQDFNEGAANITFDHIPTVTAPSVVGNAGFQICTNPGKTPAIGGAAFAFFYSDTAPTTVVQPISVTNISYDTTAATPAGPVVLFSDLIDGGYVNSGTANNITPPSASLDGAGHPYDPTASNAAVSTSNFGNTLFATTSPNIGNGATSAAGAWVLPLNGSGNSWTSGDKIYITVARHDTTNCETAGSPDSIGFSAVPTVTSVAAFNGATTTPTVTASLAQMGSCSSFSGIKNVLVLTFTNSGTISSGTATDSFGHGYAAEFTIFGVSYAVSGDVTAGNQGFVDVANGYNAVPTFGTISQPNDSLVGGSVVPAFPLAAFPGGPSNAKITATSISIVANKPSVTIGDNNASTGDQAQNAPISPITITEGGPGALGGGVTGYACVTMASGNNEWNATTSTPTATLGGGFGSATVPVTVETTGTQTGPGTLEFQIPTASTSTPGTVTLSGLAVNVGTTGGPLSLRANFAYMGINAACAGTTAYAGNPFIIANFAGRIFGQTQDGTAAQIAKVYPPACVPGVPSAANETAAVLVTNGSYQDALSASYLAGQLGTSVLTTPTNSVSQDALNSLRINGVTEVFVVGGPLAVSQSNVTQLQNTPSFNCGGISQRTTVDGQPVDLVVQQIFGQTADGTAAAVATFPGAGVPGVGHFPGAYGGSLNDTTGSNGSPASAAPDTNVTTAILATDQSFTDAASASAIAQTNHFPLLLTGPSSLSSDAATALTNDAVQQVIVMGGPIAISDNVLTSVEAMGISVLRVAGQDFTDTSQLLAQFELNSINFLTGITTGLDYDPGWLIFARGDYYTDGIVAGRVPAVFGGIPILLTWDPNNEGNPSGTNYLGPFLHQVGQVFSDMGTPPDQTINALQIIGGAFAISIPLETALATSLNG